MTKAKKSQITVSKNRFANSRLKLIDDRSYLISEDADADLKLPGIKASIYKEGERWILMNIKGAELLVNEQLMTSVELRENLNIKLGSYRIQYSSDLKKNPTSSEINPVRIVLLSLALVFMLYIIFAGEKKPPAIVPEVAENSVEIAKSTLTADDDIHTEVTANVMSMKPQAFQYYNEALSVYDSGDFKNALIRMLDAASIDSQNQLIQNKIVDWENKINMEISRLYEQACFDIGYYRYYEAESLFRIIVELSVDQTDVRIIESKRLLSEINNNSDQKLGCGG